MKERRESQPHGGRSSFRDRSTETDGTWRRRIGLAGAAWRSALSLCAGPRRHPRAGRRPGPGDVARRASVARSVPEPVVGADLALLDSAPQDSRSLPPGRDATDGPVRRSSESTDDGFARPLFHRAITSGRTPPLPGRRPKQALVDAEFWSVLDGCLGDLPRTLAQAFMLREIEQIEVETLCATLDLSPANLRVRLHRARLLLRDCLETRWFGSRSDEAPRTP